MKVEELRIGNFVFPLDQGGEELNIAHKVSLITRTYVGVSFTTEVNRAYNEIKPIILTEEWLDRFSFNKWKSSKIWSKKGLMIYYHKGEKSFCYGKASNRTKIKKVHQLQNLYYALTGEELEIK